MISAVLFWFSVAMVLYAYAGYPALLRMFAFFSRNAARQRFLFDPVGKLPAISLLISAHNEESVIEAKIRNSLELDYPRDLLEIVVISDGSTDKTNEIVSRYADNKVTLRAFERRSGKTACLNKSLPLAAGGIIVFSDANSRYGRNVLREIAKHFFDPRIGFVTGWTQYVGTSKGDVRTLGLYARLELMMKKYEGLFGSCVGADGAIFAIRKELYRPLRDQDINDFVIPLAVVRQGYRGVLAEKAFCVETSAGSASAEFHRQVRITNRTIRAIFRNASLLNPVHYGFFSFALFSHKLCRFLVPFFLVCLFLSNLTLLNHGIVYFAAFVSQVVFYCSAGIGCRVNGMSHPSRLFAALRDFVMVNTAIYVAWIRYLQGATYTTWSPTPR